MGEASAPTFIGYLAQLGERTIERLREALLLESGKGLKMRIGIAEAAPLRAGATATSRQ